MVIAHLPHTDLSLGQIMDRCGTVKSFQPVGPLMNCPFPDLWVEELSFLERLVLFGVTTDPLFLHCKISTKREIPTSVKSSAWRKKAGYAIRMT